MGTLAPRLLPMISTPARVAGAPDPSQIRAIVAKITKRCNIRCHYCYEHLGREGDMPLDVFRRVTEWAIAGTTSPSVTVIFHGGEPTILGEVWFAKAVAAARAVATRYGKVITFGLQSNGVDVSDSMLRLFAREGIRLSISIDGPDSLSKMRPHAASAVDTWSRARMHGLNPGVLMTINHDNCSHFSEIYKWLRDQVGVRIFKANVVSAVGLGEKLPELPTEAIVSAQLAILQSMARDVDGNLVVEENLGRELLRYFCPDNAPAQRSLCHGRPCGAGTAVVGVSPNGTLLPCGRFGWDEEQFALGSIATTEDEAGCNDHRSVDRVRQFHGVAPFNWTQCSECGARGICSFGCQAFIVRSAAKVNIECEPTRYRYRFYQKHEDQLRPLASAIAERHGRHWFASTDVSVDDNYHDHGQYYDYNDYTDTHL